MEISGVHSGFMESSVFLVFLRTLRSIRTSSAYDMHDQIRGKLSLNLNAQKVSHV